MGNAIAELLKRSVLNKALKSACIHASVVLILLTSLFVFDSKDVHFIGWALLIFPLGNVFLECLRKKKKYDLPYGIEADWESVFLDKKELDRRILNLIVSTVESKYESMSIIKKVISVICFFVISICFSVSFSTYLLAVSIYSAMSLRYFLILLQLKGKEYSIVIIDAVLEVPVFGFTQFYYLKIRLADIKYCEVFCSRDRIDMIYSGNVDELLITGGTFIQGVCLYYNKKNSITLSTAVVSAEFLYKLVELLHADKSEEVTIRLI